MFRKQIVVLILMLPMFAHAQSQSRPGYRSVEEGIEDVSPMAKSGRLERLELRHPTGFEQVYEITTPDGKTAYIRVDGGLVAMFKRADYATGTGEALLPPGVVYHIGSPKVATDERSAIRPASASNRISTRLSTRATGKRRNAAAKPKPEAKPPNAIRVLGPASIIENEPYRRLRITQLLRSAREEK